MYYLKIMQYNSKSTETKTLATTQTCEKEIIHSWMLNGSKKKTIKNGTNKMKMQYSKPSKAY